MLGKVLQNFQQVGIYNQLCKGGRGYRCPSSSTGDIQNHVAGWSKSCFNVSASYNTKAKVNQTTLQEKSETERWENLANPRSNTSDGQLVINNNVFYRVDYNYDLDEAIFIHPSRECGATRRFFSIDPKSSKHKPLDHAINSNRISVYGRGTFNLNDPSITKLLIRKQGFLEQIGVSLLLNRSFHVLSKDENKYSNKSLQHELVCKHSSSAEPGENIDLSVAKLSEKDKSNVKPAQVKCVERKKGTVSPEKGEVTSSHEPQKGTQFFHAFHPENVDDSIKAETTEGKLDGGGGSGSEKPSPKSYSSAQSNDVLKPDRRSDPVYKMYLGTKSPSDLDVRNAYSTSCDEGDVLRRSDLERKDPLVKLPDQCASKRNMSSLEAKAPQKGDPPTKVKMELQGKGKPPAKKKGKKAPKKKPKKKVCGSQQSSQISCLDICHTGISCSLKVKKKAKGKPQKCLVVGCRGGLGGLCYKLKNMFKKDKKCKFKKMKK